MRLALTLLLAAILVGCGPRAELNPGQPSTARSEAVSPQNEPEPFHYDQAGGRITLDSTAPPGQKRRFDLGQGSITIETIRSDDGSLVFQYTPEIEGGYTVYECKVPIGQEPVVFRVNRDGTPGEPSFDLSKCKRLRMGNLHFPPNP